MAGRLLVAAGRGNREDVGKNNKNEWLDIGIRSLVMKYYSVIRIIRKIINFKSWNMIQWNTVGSRPPQELSWHHLKPTPVGGGHRKTEERQANPCR